MPSPNRKPTAIVVSLLGSNAPEINSIPPAQIILSGPCSAGVIAPQNKSWWLQISPPVRQERRMHPRLPLRPLANEYLASSPPHGLRSNSFMHFSISPQNPDLTTCQNSLCVVHWNHMPRENPFQSERSHQFGKIIHVQTNLIWKGHSILHLKI